MPVVTALKPQKDNKRVNVYLDGKFGFGVDLDNLVRFGIKIEREFTQDDLDVIVHEADFQKIFAKILNFSTLRPRSKKEIVDWMVRKKITEGIRDRLLERLENLNMVDDARFADWWVEQRTSFKAKSPKEIKYELLKKGIAKEIVEDAILRAEIDEAKMIRKLYDKVKYRWLNLDENTKRKKAFLYLARKGFSYEIIKNVIE